jgi:hypothetical protein
MHARYTLPQALIDILPKKLPRPATLHVIFAAPGASSRLDGNADKRLIGRPATPSGRSVVGGIGGLGRGLFLLVVGDDERLGEVVGGGLPDPGQSCDGGPGQASTMVELGQQASAALPSGSSELLGTSDGVDDLLVAQLGQFRRVCDRTLDPFMIVARRHAASRPLLDFRKPERLRYG